MSLTPPGGGSWRAGAAGTLHFVLAGALAGPGRRRLGGGGGGRGGSFSRVCRLWMASGAAGLLQQDRSSRVRASCGRPSASQARAARSRAGARQGGRGRGAPWPGQGGQGRPGPPGRPRSAGRSRRPAGGGRGRPSWGRQRRAAARSPRSRALLGRPGLDALGQREPGPGGPGPGPAARPRTGRQARMGLPAASSHRASPARASQAPHSGWAGSEGAGQGQGFPALGQAPGTGRPDRRRAAAPGPPVAGASSSQEVGLGRAGQGSPGAGRRGYAAGFGAGRRQMA